MNTHNKHYRHVHDLPQLSAVEKDALAEVEQEYAFRVNDYYLNLIDWDDPGDPIRRLVIPNERELLEWGTMDPSSEEDYTVASGTQHKYTHTALMLCAETCDSYCRYCFRKRLTMRQNEEVLVNLKEGIHYIRKHPEVNNVLLTGGDPLTLTTNRLRRIVGSLSEIEHVKIIRVGSKVPAFNPHRILHDPDLTRMLGKYSTKQRRIYLMSHFTHPRELTAEAVEAVHQMVDAGVIVANQCPVVAGVNDDPEILSELFNKLSRIGATPYYIFQGRPAKGNAMFEVPIVRASEIFTKALAGTSGLGRRARLTMSHVTGKVEILGYDQLHIYLRYHRAADEINEGRFLICERNDDSYWLDDLKVIHSFKPGEREHEALSA